YSVADGLLHDNVNRIRQDTRGFMWFCTGEGISRFDGYAFANFTTADGLPDRHVNDFLETRNGAIYLATDAGIARLNPTGLASSRENPLFKVILPENSKSKVITVLFQDDLGQVWVGTGSGLFKLNEQDELEAFELGTPLVGIHEIHITAIIQDRRRSLWLATADNGLFRILPNGEVEQFNESDGLPDVNISTVLEDRNGRLWVALRQHYVAGLILLVPEPRKDRNIVEHYYTTKDGLPADWILNLFQSSDGKIWIGTIKGLCEWQIDGASVCKTYTKENDLCDEEIWTIAEDSGHSLWIGTRCGLKKWTPYGFTAYKEADGMGHSFINSLFENQAGELFASFNNVTEQRTVSRFDGTRFELIRPFFPAKTSFGWGWKQTVWQDGDGDWWFPGMTGVYRFHRPERFEDLATSVPRAIHVGTAQTEIFRVFEDSRKDVWVSTIGTVFELWRWERATDTWQNLTPEVNFGRYRIGTAFVEDKAGNLWIGTGTERDDAALIRYRNGQFKVFAQKENPLLAGWLRDLFVDSKGRLWIADTATGVLRLDDVNADELRFVRYTTAEGLSSNGSYCLTEDEFGRIYVGSGRGIDRLTPETGGVENFTTADGLPSSDVEIAYRDRRNDLWFGTSSGLARFTPEPQRARRPPNAFITGLRVNGESRSVSLLGEGTIPSLDLDADHRQITVAFVGLGSSPGEKLQYEYRFGDVDWTPTSERTVNFANLGSGDYQFEIRARTFDRIYSQPATVAFSIAAPMWQKWWFVVAVLGLAILLFYAIYRVRLGQLLEVANMRTRIATDLHDDIGANLTKISILSEVAQQQFGQYANADGPNGTSSLLGSVAEISRESVSSMGDIVWAINPKKDSLLDLTRRMRQHAEEMFERREIVLEFHAPMRDLDLKLDADSRRNIYLIFKESINNIVRHSNASKVTINLAFVENELVLKISDDGEGFDTVQEFDGNGLLNMQKRADDCGSRLLIKSVRGKGTTLKLNLKLRATPWRWNTR
ncbi:MAG: two-component regulator propeller domain-containing protein, partial [Acidobacteriota bacterium]